MDFVIRRWKFNVRLVESLGLALSFQAVDWSFVSLLVNPTMERTRCADLASSAIEGPPVIIYEHLVWPYHAYITLLSYNAAEASTFLSKPLTSRLPSPWQA